MQEVLFFSCSFWVFSIHRPSYPSEFWVNLTNAIATWHIYGAFLQIAYYMHTLHINWDLHSCLLILIILTRTYLQINHILKCSWLQREILVWQKLPHKYKSNVLIDKWHLLYLILFCLFVPLICSPKCLRMTKWSVLWIIVLSCFSPSSPH